MLSSQLALALHRPALLEKKAGSELDPLNNFAPIKRVLMCYRGDKPHTSKHLPVHFVWCNQPSAHPRSSWPLHWTLTTALTRLG